MRPPDGFTLAASDGNSACRPAQSSSSALVCECDPRLLYKSLVWRGFRPKSIGIATTRRIVSRLCGTQAAHQEPMGATPQALGSGWLKLLAIASASAPTTLSTGAQNARGHFVAGQSAHAAPPMTIATRTTTMMRRILTIVSTRLRMDLWPGWPLLVFTTAVRWSGERIRSERGWQNARAKTPARNLT